MGSDSKVKLVTYNVWSNEHVAVYRRMQAIGDLVIKHDPDVIFFQEVTPHILGIFERSRWWNEYPYTASSEQAGVKTRPSFCLLLSKHPFDDKQVAHMEVEGENKEPLDAVMVWSVTFRIPAEPDRSGFRWALGTMDLVTCHLPAPTREAGVRGVERRLQAKMLLQRCRFPTHGNVVIGGDLSWDEDLDGPFPLEHGWLDAWKALKPPYVSGWTLDADANPMLRPCSGRKRPDRFLCKLGSRFFLESVEMVGTEVISGVEYCDDGGDSFDVLPSNHFGLLLTLSLRRNC